MRKFIHTSSMGLGLVLALAGCQEGEPGDVRIEREPAEVQVSTPVRSASVEAHPANVVSTDEARVATRVSGMVRKVEVDVGSAVKRGQTLVVLDATDVQASVQGSQAGLRRARQTYDRIAALAEDGAATPQELDDARAALEMAQAQVKGAAAQQEYVVLKAPFDGVITERMADPGDLAMPGQPILTVVAGSSLEIEADLPARHGAKLAEGDRVGVYDPSSGRRYQATVQRTSPALDRASRRIHVEAKLDTEEGPAPDLLPGSFVRLELESASNPTLWIPRDAIVRRGQLTGVFEVGGEQLHLRWVRLGTERDDAVELLGGVPPDARVVRNPAPDLGDGQPVSSTRSATWAVQSVR